jgi:fatty acid desaturase
VDLIGRDSRRAVLPRAKALRAPRRGSLQAAVQLWTLALVWSLMPPRLLGVPATLALVARHFAGLGSRLGEVPDPARALRHPDGLVSAPT